MASLKLFRGEPRLLRFEADGVCVTLDLVRSADGIRFLERARPPDARRRRRCRTSSRTRGCPAAVVARSYPGYEEFRERRRALDPSGRFRSELSARLAL